jgi:hypothetical protein
MLECRFGELLDDELGVSAIIKNEERNPETQVLPTRVSICSGEAILTQSGMNENFYLIRPYYLNCSACV